MRVVLKRKSPADVEKGEQKWADLDLEAGFLYWEEVGKRAREQGLKRQAYLAKKEIKRIVEENSRLLTQEKFERFLRANKVKYVACDKKVAEDFDKAIWEYKFWGQIPNWLKTVISCSVLGIFYSVAIGSRLTSCYQYMPLETFTEPMPTQALEILELVKEVPDTGIIERIALFEVVKNTQTQFLL
ncbi:MAG: hypothetical protein QMD66_03445 [Actinomycetota bacterium]|nr:hypothetical protein [Actinomycetota bacterium]